MYVCEYVIYIYPIDIPITPQMYKNGRRYTHVLVGEARLRDQVVDERGEAGELGVAEGVVPEGHAHDALVWGFGEVDDWGV